MACFRPLTAWQLDGGEIVFKERGKIRRELELPCGRCIGCRQVRVRAWSIRCMHEAQMHSEPSSFVTLTYEDPAVDPSLRYHDFQLFMRYLRRRYGPTRFFMCGEYGELNFRPHFHALLFGRAFGDRQVCGKDLYRSASLEGLWRHGFSSVGDVSAQSASYVAGYALKKVTGELASRRYSRVDLRTGECVQVVPEFGRMSLKPGIGYSWFQKYYRDVFGARDGVVVNGKVCPSPRYYMDLLQDVDPRLCSGVEFDRIMNAGKFAEDRTPERLATRELCAKANLRSRVL